MGLVALLVGAAVGVLAIGAVLPADVAMGLGSGISRSLSLVGVLVIVLSVRLSGWTGADVASSGRAG